MKIETIKSVVLNSFRQIKYAALCMLALTVIFASCNKDDDNNDEEEYLTLEGTPDFDLPIYAMVGDTLDLHARGVTTERATYTWAYPGLDTLYESDDQTHIKVIIPDSLAIYEITLTADCGEEYYSSSMVQYVTALGDSSITGTVKSEKIFTDPRDMREYGIVEIGNLEWFSENLKWAGAGQGFGKTEAAAHVMGRLYTWNDATNGESASGLGNGVQGVCPEGWSIPTNEDWVDLAQAVNGGVEVDFAQDWKGIAPLLMADAQFNGRAVWPYSPNVTPTNDYGWNALAAGRASNNYSLYSNMLSYGFWWSCSEKDSNTAYYKYIYSEFPNVSVNSCAKDGMAVSVRCVRLKK